MLSKVMITQQFSPCSLLHAPSYHIPNEKPEQEII